MKLGLILCEKRQYLVTCRHWFWQNFNPKSAESNKNWLRVLYDLMVLEQTHVCCSVNSQLQLSHPVVEHSVLFVLCLSLIVCNCLEFHHVNWCCLQWSMCAQICLPTTLALYSTLYFWELFSYPQLFSIICDLVGLLCVVCSSLCSLSISSWFLSVCSLARSGCRSLFHSEHLHHGPTPGQFQGYFKCCSSHMVIDGAQLPPQTQWWQA